MILLTFPTNTIIILITFVSILTLNHSTVHIKELLTEGLILIKHMVEN